MRKYTWDEYYEKFYDWAESTQVRNLSGLTSLGTAEEVAEIIVELQVNESASNRLLSKAVDARLQFSADNLLDFLYYNDEELAVAAVYNSADSLTVEDMKNLYCVLDDDIIIEVCDEYNIALPENLREEEDEENIIYEEPEKLGFLGVYF